MKLWTGFPFGGEDKKIRCGSGPFLSTDWMWSLAYRLRLTKYKKDPFITFCAVDDNLTDSNYKYSKMLSNEEEMQRVFRMIDEINKDVNHPKIAALYKIVLRLTRSHFDK